VGKIVKKSLKGAFLLILLIDRVTVQSNLV